MLNVTLTALWLRLIAMNPSVCHWFSDINISQSSVTMSLRCGG